MGANQYGTGDRVGILIIGFLIVLSIFLAFIVGSAFNNIKEELGGAICDEEYGLEFESYGHKILTCKPALENFDGIQIRTSVIGEE